MSVLNKITINLLTKINKQIQKLQNKNNNKKERVQNKSESTMIMINTYNLSSSKKKSSVRSESIPSSSSFRLLAPLPARAKILKTKFSKRFSHDKNKSDSKSLFISVWNKFNIERLILNFARESNTNILWQPNGSRVLRVSMVKREIFSISNETSKLEVPIPVIEYYLLETLNSPHSQTIIRFILLVPWVW